MPKSQPKGVVVGTDKLGRPYKSVMGKRQPIVKKDEPKEKPKSHAKNPSPKVHAFLDEWEKVASTKGHTVMALGVLLHSAFWKWLNDSEIPEEDRLKAALRVLGVIRNKTKHP